MVVDRMDTRNLQVVRTCGTMRAVRVWHSSCALYW